MRVPASLVLTLSYAASAVSVLVGWLTLGHTAVSIAIELLVALHYAGRRILRAEGVVREVDPLYRPSSGVRPTAGEPLDHDGRRLVSQTERRLLSAMCVVTGGAMAVGAGDALVTSPTSVVVWVLFTAALIVGERQRFLAWIASDAPRTADPLTQTRHVAVRILAFAGVLLFGASALRSNEMAGALVLLVTAWAIDVAQQAPDRMESDPQGDSRTR